MCVIGGSYGGLCAALALRCVGHSVKVYERNSDPERVGGGIVIQPDFAEYLEAHGYARLETVAVPTVRRRILNPDGSVAQATPDGVVYTAWDTLLRSLRQALGIGGLVSGVSLESFSQGGESVTARYSDGSAGEFDLLIGADGVGSTIRRQLLPDIQPVFAGYVGYRGLVPEAELPLESLELFQDSFVLYSYPHSHILHYFIPGKDGELKPGERRLNWVWYVNTADGPELERILTDAAGKKHRLSLGPGEMSKPEVDALVERARRELPLRLADTVARTREPFVQAIFDLQVSRMHHGRVLLLGDSACVVRPHTASGTSKAAGDATALGDVLGHVPSDLDSALDRWERERLSVARRIAQYGKNIARGNGLGSVG